MTPPDPLVWKNLQETMKTKEVARVEPLGAGADMQGSTAPDNEVSPSLKCRERYPLEGAEFLCGRVAGHFGQHVYKTSGAEIWWDATSKPDSACSRCGGPYRFDTVVPSVIWNETIRARGLSEFLCLTCIVEAFCCFGESFTATLWGGSFQGGAPIEVRIGGEVAVDAAHISEENTLLRAKLSDLQEAAKAEGR